MRSFYANTITTPHIPLDIPVEDALAILKNVSEDIDIEKKEDETIYTTSGGFYQFGFHEKAGKVSSTWYNDPSGRKTGIGKRKKIFLYLKRYGRWEDWENGINNGWIQFFFNETEAVGMAYGIHMDVIRFNSLKDVRA